MGTSGADTTLVPKLYAECFVGPAGLQHCKVLCYADNDWGDAEVAELCKVLPLCQSLECLSLAYNTRVSDDSVESLCNVLPALHNFISLELSETGAGRAGALRLAATVGRCVSLREVGMNCVDEDAANQLRAAWEKAGKDLSNLYI